MEGGGLWVTRDTDASVVPTGCRGSAKGVVFRAKRHRRDKDAFRRRWSAGPLRHSVVNNVRVVMNRAGQIASGLGPHIRPRHLSSAAQRLSRAITQK